MSGPVLAGMAVTSHNTGTLSAVTFDTVSVSTTVPCTGGWYCGDIGSPTLAGNQSLSGGTWTIQAGRSDIYGTSDQFHFVWHTPASHGYVSAPLVSQPNTNSWADSNNTPLHC